MPFGVLLDACVLYPLPLRDTLLRCAEQGLYEIRWSQRILDEVARNLVADDRATPAQAAKLIDAMQRACEDAEIPALAIASLEPRMTNESADRHVLATAVASNDAKTIVTSNLRDFQAAACQPFGVEVAHPDAFLCSVYERAPAGIQAVLDLQAADLKHPPMVVDDVLDRLRVHVPEFVTREIGRAHV